MAMAHKSMVICNVIKKILAKKFTNYVDAVFLCMFASPKMEINLNSLTQFKTTMMMTFHCTKLVKTIKTWK